MTMLHPLLARLSPSHRAALEWFRQRQGQEVPWPEPLPDGTFLANRAKGIHKPQDLAYALSVRQTLSGPYADREPELRPDGTWAYLYFQEGHRPEDRDRLFTNRGLMACMADEVPIGVMRQTRPKPGPRYQVLGLALVREWRDGYFLLDGFSPEGTVGDTTHYGRGGSTFDPACEDARERVRADIVRRQGQGRFRAGLLAAYGGRCAITAFDVAEVLEAVHIVPYKGEATNTSENGLLLRADLHTLFDLGLIAVDPAGMTVLVSSSLAGSSYGDLAGRLLAVPKDPSHRPSCAALAEHRKWAKL
jgi:putative restriction endonuclease